MYKFLRTHTITNHNNAGETHLSSFFSTMDFTDSAKDRHVNGFLERDVLSWLIIDDLYLELSIRFSKKVKQVPIVHRLKV